MGLCMPVDILMNFMRAKFQIATKSNKRAVAVRTFHDFDSYWRRFSSFGDVHISS